jgi:hypothetical protein
VSFFIACFYGISCGYGSLTSNKAEQLINQRESFEVIGLGGKMGDVVSMIENIIETKGLSCCIYTYGLVAAAGATVLGGPMGVFGLASTIGMAVHNIVTYDPDYELAKHVVDNKLSVTYKK